MKNSEKFMNEFLDKLVRGDFKKENLPNTGSEITGDYVNQQITEYDNFLKSYAAK